MADVRGIDISEHQGAWNWSAPQDTFVISRAWSGFRRDHQFNRNWPASRGRTIRGTYAFAEPSGGSPEQQADAYLGIINAAGGHEAGDLIPMLDIEDARKWAGRDPIGFSLRFLARLSSNIGRNAGIYTDRGFLAGSLRNDRRFEPYPLWIANWNGNGSVGSYHDPRAPWGWFIHQYRGHPLDLNRANAAVLNSLRFGGPTVVGGGDDLPYSPIELAKVFNDALLLSLRGNNEVRSELASIQSDALLLILRGNTEVREEFKNLVREALSS